MKTYKIIRFFQDPDKSSYVVETGLTLEEAQEHCKDPETSSQTCEGEIPNARTRVHGPWFDGYEEE